MSFLSALNILILTLLCFQDDTNFSCARGYKTFFMLNSANHEIVNAHKYKNIKKLSISQAPISLECYFSCQLGLKCQRCLDFNIYEHEKVHAQLR